MNKKKHKKFWNLINKKVCGDEFGLVFAIMLMPIGISIATTIFSQNYFYLLIPLGVYAIVRYFVWVNS